MNKSYLQIILLFIIQILLLISSLWFAALSDATGSWHFMYIIVIFFISIIISFKGITYSIRQKKLNNISVSPIIFASIFIFFPFFNLIMYGFGDSNPLVPLAIWYNSNF